MMNNLVLFVVLFLIYVNSRVDILADNSLPLQLSDFFHDQRDASHRLLVLLLVAHIARIDTVVD